MPANNISLSEQLIKCIIQDIIDLLCSIVEEGGQDCQGMINNLQALLPYAQSLERKIITPDQQEQLMQVWRYLEAALEYLIDSNAPEADSQDCNFHYAELCTLLYWVGMPFDDRSVGILEKLFPQIMKQHSRQNHPSTTSSNADSDGHNPATSIDEEIKSLEEELRENLPHITITAFLPDKDYDAELQRLTGLESVKRSLAEHITNYLMLKERQALHPDINQKLSFNTIFKGRSGTGKTTVARLLAGIMKNRGIIPDGHLVEVDAATLISPYVGVSAKIAKYVALRAVGGILFIDEAYSLSGGKGKHGDAGKEVIDALTPILENYRDRLVVILAGYNKEMDQMLSQVNTGFASRFRQSITFEDYNAEEMLTIFMGMTTRDYYQLSAEAIATLSGVFDLLYRKRNSVRGFANARTVRSIYETICSRASNRMLREKLSGTDLDNITIADVRLTPQELRAAMGIL